MNTPYYVFTFKNHPFGIVEILSVDGLVVSRVRYGALIPRGELVRLNPRLLK